MLLSFVPAVAYTFHGFLPCIPVITIKSPGSRRPDTFWRR